MRGSKIVHLDDIDEKPNNFYSPFYCTKREHHLVIEGLISGDKFLEIMEELRSLLKREKNWNTRGRIPVEVLSFEEDREACLWNDRNRNRKVKATLSINNMKIVIPEEELEAEFPKFKFYFRKPMPVFRASGSLIWAKEILGDSFAYKVSENDDGRIGLAITKDIRFLIWKEVLVTRSIILVY